jgi:hypothetical protein
MSALNGQLGVRQEVGGESRKPMISKDDAQPNLAVANQSEHWDSGDPGAGGRRQARDQFYPSVTE